MRTPRSFLFEMLSSKPQKKYPDVTKKDPTLEDFILTSLKTISERESGVLNLRYGFSGSEPRTLASVGRELGLTRERIRQIEKKAIQKLRHHQRSKYFKPLFDELGKQLCADKTTESDSLIKVLGSKFGFGECSRQGCLNFLLRMRPYYRSKIREGRQPHEETRAGLLITP